MAQKERNDRLIAVAVHVAPPSERSIAGRIARRVAREIEHFFISYNELKGKEFVPLGRFGPKRALKLVKRGILSEKKAKR